MFMFLISDLSLNETLFVQDKVILEVNEQKGFQVGLHVDAASGGFIAPFQDGLQEWDFRLKSVLSISASGHKFGESACGTGWVIFRERKDLSEHIEVEVTYLGGTSFSSTLNFSRPATGLYVQAYKFLRLGMSGYKQKVANQLHVTSVFRESMRAYKWINGEPLFQILDADRDMGLPVCSLRVNPKLDVAFTDFTIQHAVGEFHWYVGAYHLSFEDFGNGGVESAFCSDEPKSASMFRVVFKSNLTLSLCEDLTSRIDEVITHLKEEAESKKPEVFNQGFKSFKEVLKNKATKTNFHSAC